MSNLKRRKNEYPSKAGRYYRYFAAAVCTIFFSSSVFAASADSNTTTNFQPQALNFAGIYSIRNIDPNLTGAGVKFGIVSRSYTYNGIEPQNDYAIPVKHPCFANKEISFLDDAQMSTNISPHAAAVASILFGEDPNAFAPGIGSFYFKGIVPDAKADIYEFRHFIRDIIFAGKPADVDVLSISLGSQFEDWWTRGINRLAEANGISIVAGVGNGTNVNDPVLYPGAGPNVLAVGVIDSVNGPNDITNLANFSLPTYQHSSIGPTRDGRCKPDIVAPGNCIAATADANQNYNKTGNWSSFSTPIVAGTIGLLIEKAWSDPNLQLALRPSGNCVLRAIVMNSARKLPFWHKGDLTKDDDHQVPLDYLQGAGMLDAAAAYKQLIAGPASDGMQKSEGWDNNRVTPAASRVYYFNTKASTDQYITATLVWNRHFQQNYPFESLSQKDVNLRLELWAVDANNPAGDHLLDYSDSAVDNVGHIYYPAEPNHADYAISVSFSNPDRADANAAEQYGLAWAVKGDSQKNSILWYDLNDDGVVNNIDLALLTKYIEDAANPSFEYNPRFDVNMDGKIDLNDLRLVGLHSSMTAAWHK